jgi:acylphosphatase
MMVAKRIVYIGRVQGVGFRYTAQQVAQGFAVAGYVRNLANGNVELLAEGEGNQVDAFLQAVGNRMADCIDRTNVHDESPSGAQSFRIRH